MDLVHNDEKDATQKPSIILVHGAWHVPEIYQPFIESLESAGYSITCPLLPSCDPSRRLTHSFAEDVQTIRDATLSLLESSGTEIDAEEMRIIYLLHSYGGAVGTQAAQNLSMTERTAKGLKGGISHLIYMCAFMLQPGESVANASMPRPVPEPLEFSEVDGTSFLQTSPLELFFHDVEEDLASRLSTLLQRMNGKATTEPIDYAAWKLLPMTYVKCTGDKVLFLEWQERQIRAVEEAGVAVDVHTLDDTSHSPYLSRKDDMLRIVEDVAQLYS